MSNKSGIKVVCPTCHEFHKPIHDNLDEMWSECTECFTKRDLEQYRVLRERNVIRADARETVFPKWKEIWEHFNRLQDRVMADKTSKEDFFAESEEERLGFYEWMQKQAGEFSIYM